MSESSAVRATDSPVPLIVRLDEPLARRHLAELLAMDADTQGDAWAEGEWLLPLPGKWTHSLLADVDGAPVGAAVCSLKPDVVHVHRLVIAASHRGRGIGTMLLRAVAADAAHLRRRVTIKVHPENVDARRLYERLGFALVDRSAANLSFALNP